MKRIKLDPTYTQERMDEDTETRIVARISTEILSEVYLKLVETLEVSAASGTGALSAIGALSATEALAATEALSARVQSRIFQKLDEFLKQFQVFRAAETGNYKKLAEILSSGSSEGAENVGQESENFRLINSTLSPLNVAVQNGYPKCVKILIDHGVDLNSKDDFRVTPLQCAVMHGKYKCLKMLLEAGADCSIPIDASVAGDVNNTTLLHLAAKCNQMQCIEELIRFGANCRAVDEKGRTSLYIACEGQLKECVLAHIRNAHDRDFINIPNRRNNTPLHLAVKFGMIECVQELVSLGADVNFRNMVNMSPLHLACCSCKLNVDTKIQILKILVLDGRDTDMSSAIHPSYLNGYDSEVMKFLIAYGASINVRHERTGYFLFEKFLNWTIDSEVLEYCMNCLPRLPFLHSLNVPLDFYAAFPEKFLVYNCPDLFGRVDARFARNESNTLVNIPNNGLPVISIANGPVKKSNLSEQPFFDVVYNHVNRELQALTSIPNHPNQNVSFSMFEFLRKQYLLRLQNYLKYEKAASCPRTLQHHCRFSIRKCMGPTNIKLIPKLTLPRRLKSYLLFEWEG